MGANIDTLLEQIYQRARREREGESLSLREWLDMAEAWRIVLALRECNGNRSQAAKSLGIGRRTLYSKMRKLGIEATWRA